MLSVEVVNKQTTCIYTNKCTFLHSSLFNVIHRELDVDSKCIIQMHDRKTIITTDKVKCTTFKHENIGGINVGKLSLKSIETLLYL